MKTRIISMMLTTIILASLLSACSSKEGANPSPTTEVSPSATPIATVTPSAVPSPSATPVVTTKPSPTVKPSVKPIPSKKPDPSKKPTPTKKPTTVEMPKVKDMMDEMLKQVEQPSLMELEGDMLKDAYALDLSLLEEFTVRAPMMNVKTNEIAIFKVKKAADIATVKTAIKNRALSIQKQFETYLQDQYENAKNYKIITNGNYVLFVISESADDLEKAFTSFFAKK